VKDVFDALLAATLHQMEAYSELVAATAKTLQEYVAENKQLVSGEEVWDWLVKNLPGPAASVTDPKPEDATLVHVGVTLTGDSASGIYALPELSQPIQPDNYNSFLALSS
jgi:hypothetical protein